MKRLIAILTAVLSLQSHATLVRENLWGVRQTGMGNAFVAIADDNNALWYNPAGLARTRGFHFNLFDLQLSVDSMDTLSRLYNAIDQGNYNDLVRADTQYMQFSAKPTFMGPYFALAAFDNIMGYYDFRDLTSPDALVDIYTVNDIGLALAFGLPVGDRLSLGATIRAVQRSGIDTILDTQDLLNMVNLSAGDFETQVYDAIESQTGMGWGISLNAGAIYDIPMKNRDLVTRLGVMVEDIGNTRFFAIGSANAPDSIPMKVHLGGALRYSLGNRQELNFALDYRDAFSNENIGKRSHFGVEYKNAVFAIRTGLNQGYPTLGFSLTQPPHTQIHFSTYAVEVGEGLWENSRRFWTLQLIIGFNPI